jgi:dTDP-4-dehydrorhamnose 3,5-epimerase
MKFTETPIKGAFILELEPLEDDRGFFARSFCRREFEARGLNPKVAQCNISYNRQKHTLRGMHFQIAPYEEAKLITCIRGAIWDVIIDLRSYSPAYCHWFALDLTADNHKMLYIPEGVAHGFQTLENESTVFYQISEFYHPQSAQGVRWNDPVFGIRWPHPHSLVSARDQNFSDFKP